MTRSSLNVALVCGLLLSVAVTPSPAASSLLSRIGRAEIPPGMGLRGAAPGFSRNSLELSGAAAKISEIGDAARGHARALGGKVELVAKAAATAAADGLDLEKYPKLFAAGGICASFTHWVTVPLDVVKTRSQVMHACDACHGTPLVEGTCLAPLIERGPTPLRRRI